jgi:hypothetical protein
VKRSASAERERPTSFARRSSVQESADEPVAECREPAHVAGSERAEPASHQLDEHELAQAQPDAFAARAPLLGLGHGELDEPAEGIVRRERLTDVKQARQRGEERVERADIAAEEPAHQPEPIRTVAALRDREREPARDHLSHEGHDLGDGGPASHPGAIDIT